MIILIFPIVYSGTLNSYSHTSISWADDFNYDVDDADADNFNKNPSLNPTINWTISPTVVSNCPGDLRIPINSSGRFFGGSFGINTTCTGSNVRSIETIGGMGVNISDKKIIISYNFSVQNISGDNAALRITLSPGNKVIPKLVLSHASRGHDGDFSYNAKVFLSGGGSAGSCNLTNSTIHNEGFVGEFVIVIDQPNSLFSWYINGSSFECEQISLSGSGLDNESLGTIQVSNQYSGTPDIHMEAYFDDLRIGEGTTDVTVSSGGADVCPFPLLFCDDFNYNTPLQGNGWIIFDAGGSTNNSFSPINNQLVLDSGNTLRPFHSTPIFPTTYFPDSEGRFIRHFQAPAFSSEFILNFNNNSDNEFKYSAFEKVGNVGWTIRIQMDTDGFTNTGGNASGDMNWAFRNSTSTSASDFVELCSNCTFSGTDIFIKINSFFKQRDSFPFNSSVTRDEVAVYANDKLLGKWFNFITDERFTSIREYEFSKINEANFTIDNYNVMLGTDTLIDTSSFFYDDFFDNTTAGQQQIPFDTGTGELIDAVNSIWVDFGMVTQASRIFAGIFLMFFLALILFGAFISTGTPVNVLAIGIIELFFMVLLIYIKLLPAWIGFVLVIITGGIAALMFKMASG